MNKDNLNCPVDFVTINENKARLTALYVLMFVVFFMVNGSNIILIFLLLDFFLRAFKLGQYSILGNISDVFIKQFNIKNKPVDRAPKRFAAGVGMMFTLAMLVLTFFELSTVVMVLGMVIIVFAFLESVLAICVGCYVYSIGLKLFK